MIRNGTVRCRPHIISYWRSIVTMPLKFIASEIKRDIGRKSHFFHTPVPRKKLWENGCEYFHAVCSQPSKIPGLPCRWRKYIVTKVLCLVFTHSSRALKTDRQTNRRKMISIASVLRNARWKRCTCLCCMVTWSGISSIILLSRWRSTWSIILCNTSIRRPNYSHSIF